MDVKLADRNRQKQTTELGNGMRKLTKVPSSIKNEPRDGTTT
jgi:hypothetical protein